MEIFFFRESPNTVDDQADIEESPSFEYNFGIEPKNESPKLEMSNMLTKIDVMLQVLALGGLWSMGEKERVEE